MELDRTLEVAKIFGDQVRLTEIGQSAGHPRRPRETFPIYKVSIGNQDPEAPVLGLVGGVHGLEQIGSHVCLALMHSFAQLSRWDKNLQKLLAQMRVFFIPVVNPWGLRHGRRSNARGVDLMRNSPVSAIGKVPFLVGGHRLSSLLPWYRGEEGAGFEPESLALIEAVNGETARSSTAVVVDIHSGFGFKDRLWFPYAHRVEPFPDLDRVHALKCLLDQTYPHHFYHIEPQTHSYMIHGDLWDHIYLHRRTDAGMFLPLTLEMGSWTWVKKNPAQILSAAGIFNPVRKHRIQRTLRRHNTLFEFLLRAVSSPEAWASLPAEGRQKHHEAALRLWYVKSAQEGSQRS